MRQLNDPWHPMTNPIEIKYLGKLSEESGELTAAIGRCLIQGIDNSEPNSNKINRVWLTEEISDVLANIELVISKFELNVDFINERIKAKKARLIVWHEQA
jgi:hypothetical protein